MQPYIISNDCYKKHTNKLLTDLLRERDFLPSEKDHDRKIFKSATKCSHHGIPDSTNPVANT